MYPFIRLCYDCAKDMKRIILILTIVVLCSCSSGKIVTNPETGVSFDKAKEDAALYVDLYCDEVGDYYIGSGIRTFRIEKRKLSEGEICVYPVYHEEELLYLILVENNTLAYCGSEDTISAIKKDGHYLAVEYEGDLYCVFKNGVFPISDNSNNDSADEVLDLLDKEYKGNYEENPMGKIKTHLIKKETKKDDGSIYHYRIGVKFMDGDEEELIRKYEEFSHGKLHSRLRSVSLFFFDISLKDKDMLEPFIADSNALDYVKEAFVDQQNELIDPVEVKE